MDNSSHKDSFYNRAKLKSIEEVHCENCSERVVFILKDNFHEFSLGLSTVLNCLAFAVKNGDLPKLPQHWASMIDDIYGSKLSFDNEICCHDYNALSDESKES